MRVVSLLPAATEIVAFLGATEHLVGVTHECDYPAIVGSRARVTHSAIPQSTDPAVIDAAVREQSGQGHALFTLCLLYTSPSPRDRTRSRMPSSA